MNTDELIKGTQEEIKELEEQIQTKGEELDNFDLSEGFDDMLDETVEHIFNMYPSSILKECDPIRYAEDLSNYEDEGRSELENEINELQEEIKNLEEVVVTLTEELKEDK